MHSDQLCVQQPGPPSPPEEELGEGVAGAGTGLGVARMGAIVGGLGAGGELGIGVVGLVDGRH